MTSPFRGSLVALPTPFGIAGEVDYAALRHLIERQIEHGTAGFVVAGTTGEAPTLTPVERRALIEFTVGVVRARRPVLAGAGASATRLACEYARIATEAGADGVLVATPSYNRPSQEGLYEHFTAVANGTPLPLVLYNIPSRTAIDLQPETVARIVANTPRTVAIKEAATSLERLRSLIELGCIDVLIGEDAWIADGMQLGAVGVIGVASNICPQRVAELVRDHHASAGPHLVEELAPLVQALALESNPAPLKAALEHLGLCRGDLRLPLVPVQPKHRERIAAVLNELRPS